MMTRVRCVLVLCLLGLLLAAGPARVSGELGGQPPQDDPGDKVTIEVVPLKHTSALKLGRILDEMFNAGAKVKRILIEADEQRNTLILRGTPRDLVTARDLIGKIDVPAPDAGEVIKTEVIHLKNASAAEIASIVQQVYPPLGGKVKQITISADHATNALILRGSVPMLADVRKLVAELDRAAAVPDVQAAQMLVYHLLHLELNKELEQTLKMVLAPEPAARFQFLRERKTVILIASRKMHDAVEALLSRLDREADVLEDLRAPDLYVRVVWLVHDPVQEAGKLSADLKGLTRELTLLGLERPRPVTQIATRSRAGDDFEMKGVARLVDVPCLFKVNGRMSVRRDKIELLLTINVSQDKGGQLCSLQTKVLAPLDRPIMVSATPTGTMTSAFVLQVYPPPPVLPPGKKTGTSTEGTNSR